jgi:hypothetical protein
MRLEIVWSGEVLPVDLLDGRVTVGGGPRDDIRLDGLPHGLLALTLDAGRVEVRAARSLRVGKALFPANVPRLVGPGEELLLPNDVVLRQPVDPQRRESRKLVGTAFVARELLSGDVAVEDTRAASLTCVTGDDKGLTFPLAADVVSIGRADDAAVRLRDRAVSRQHARLFRRGRQCWVKPLSDTNGTFLNGRQLKREAELQPGDVLELGQTMLRFNAPERAPEEQTVTGLPAPTVPPPSDAAPPLPAAQEPAPTLAAPPRPVPAPHLPSPLAGLPSPQRRPRRVPSELYFMGLGALLAATGLALAVGLSLSLR